MADIEREVEAIILAGLGTAGSDQAQQEATTNDTPGPETEERRVFDVDLFRLPGGAVLLVPGGMAHPLDDPNVVESDLAAPAVTCSPDREPGEAPSTGEADAAEPGAVATPTIPLAPLHRRGTRSWLSGVLVIVLLLAAIAASYLWMLPLTASATITSTPETQTLQRSTTLTIAEHPTMGSQVQGRALVPVSLTESLTVPATGHAHQDATEASGVVTLYNTDSQPITIPAGVSFPAANGATVVTEQAVTIQAAILPAVGTAITPAHVVQAGSLGNLAAHAIYTRCCGSAFVTATNTTAFSGGQDERDYSYIQQSDLQSAATDVLNNLMPQVSAALNRQVRHDEQVVAPLCIPRTIPSANEGAEVASVTVSVTQTCEAVAYSLTSLEQTATTLLARSANLAHYQQAGTVQVTVNGSTYSHHTATLQASLSGVWVYQFTAVQFAQFTHLIAGESQPQAQALLEQQAGISSVSIHVQRLDFRASLPANPQRISVHVFLFVW